MRIPLKIKLLAFIAATVILISLVSTVLFIAGQRKGIEKELTARGIALAEALSRSVDEGLAAENLNLINHVEDIVHTDDVIFTQVFSPLWLGVASVPADKLNDLPSPAAMEYFRKERNQNARFTLREDRYIDIYSPVFFEPHDARITVKPLVGYVRLRISTERLGQTIKTTAAVNVFAAAFLTLVALIALGIIIRRYVLRPILNLHSSMLKHRRGEYTGGVPVCSEDEIGDLTLEFNDMIRALGERETRLADEKEKGKAIIAGIGDGISILDTDFKVLYQNEIHRNMFGDHAGEFCYKALAGKDAVCEGCAVAKSVADGEIHRAERSDGKHYFDITASPLRDSTGRIIGGIEAIRDVTEKHLLEEERLKTQKLEAIGTLAGGIAHDFNNLLQGVFGYISMAAVSIDRKERALAMLQEAEHALHMSVNLTTQLLTFSKGGKPVRKKMSLKPVLENSVRFALSGSRTQYSISVDDDLCAVEADEGQITQVLQNIVLNADQAMPQGGRIAIAARNVSSRRKAHAALPGKGRHVEISVQDSGVGIPEEYLSKIFDPYFTTKEKGSGLGLATTYSIIKNHEGAIDVISEPGSGATFYVYLPAIEAEGTVAAAASVPPVLRKGKILVMDDDELIRNIAGELITALRHEVGFAKHGESALEKYCAAMESGNPFDIVILDLTIRGGLGGKETLERLLAIDPDVRAVVSSGYSDDAVISDYHKYGFSACLTKPYKLEDLQSTLNMLLSSGVHGG